MKKLLSVLHPFLIALAPILALCSRNTADVDPTSRTVLVGLGISLAAAGLVFGLFALLTRSLLRGALIASLTLILFFTYGHVFDVVKGFGWPARHHHIHLLVGGFWLLALGAGWAVLWRTRWNLAEASLVLTVAAGMMVGFSGVRLAGNSASRVSARALESPLPVSILSAKHPVAASPSSLDGGAKPDVYYIILDGYARGDVLQNIYGFDNSEFLNGLRERGFYVAEKSAANYPMTHLSLASSLNLDYLQEAGAPMGEEAEERTPYYAMIQNPLVGRIFRSNGYRFIHFATNYRGTESSEIADEVVRYRPAWLQGEFMDVLIRTSALRVMEPNVAGLHLHAFESLRGMSRKAGGKFVFAHFVVPHNPYVFDRHGGIRHDIRLDLQFKVKTGGWDNRQAYIDQLRFVNEKIEACIDSILANSQAPPVIIVQADHGSASLYNSMRGAAPEQGEAFVRERLPILNAYLVPEKVKAQLYPSISPVNSFRLLCNSMFGARYELLPERHYTGWYGSRNGLTEVTEIVKRGAPDARDVRQAKVTSAADMMD